MDLDEKSTDNTYDIPNRIRLESNIINGSNVDLFCKYLITKIMNKYLFYTHKEKEEGKMHDLEASKARLL